MHAFAIRFRASAETRRRARRASSDVREAGGGGFDVKGWGVGDGGDPRGGEEVVEEGPPGAAAGAAPGMFVTSCGYCELRRSCGYRNRGSC